MLATFSATCNAYNNKQDGGNLPRAKDEFSLAHSGNTQLLRGCYTQATCLATLRKVEGRSTFLATRNGTIAIAKWGVTREFFLATCNALNVALQVARNIASCNRAFKWLVSQIQHNFHILPLKSVIPNFLACLVFLRMALSCIKLVSSSSTSTKRVSEADIQKIHPYNHLCGGDQSGIRRHSQPMGARKFL